jgi:hypothetical protein
VNCGAIPEALLESELFGHKRGAFTDASSDKAGLFEEADGGTLFLDEIGDMPLPLQARLLRVLQDGEVLPLGGGRALRVDFRLICATHQPLAEAVRAGRFRTDLYYRLNGLTLTLPPLRARSDLAALVERLLAQEAPGRALALAPELAQAASRATPGRAICASCCTRCAPPARCSTRAIADRAPAPARGAAARRQPRRARRRRRTRCGPAARRGPTAAAVPARGAVERDRGSRTRWGLSRMTVYRRMKRWGIEAPNRGGGGASGLSRFSHRNAPERQASLAAVVQRRPAGFLWNRLLDIRRSAGRMYTRTRIYIVDLQVAKWG